VVDENGKRVTVPLKIEEYERMVEELEDILARRAYDEAKAELERGEDELIPWEQAERETEEERKRLKEEESARARRQGQSSQEHRPAPRKRTPKGAPGNRGVTRRDKPMGMPQAL
jgi:hypothetical protein